MAALVQAFPSQQSTNTLPLLQPRPQSASAALQPSTTAQSHPHTMHRSIGSYGPSTTNNNTPTNVYRNYSNTAPVAPYAFTSTPSLSNNSNNNNNNNNNNNKPTQQWSDNKTSLGRSDESKPRSIVLDSVSTSSSSSMSSEQPSRYQNSQSAASRQKSDSPATRQSSQNARPLSIASSQNPSSTPGSVAATTRPAPDRYRRGNKATAENNVVPVSPVSSAMPNVSGTVIASALYNQPTVSGSMPSVSTRDSGLGSTITGELPITADLIGNYTGQLRTHSVDDIHTHRLPYDNIIQRHAHNRRRSVGAFTAEALNSLANNAVNEEELRNVRLATLSPHLIGHPSHEARLETYGQGLANQKAHARFADFQPPSMPAYSRRGSVDSSTSAQSTTSIRPNSKSNSSNAHSTTMSMPPSPHEINLAHVPARESSTTTKRTTAPSPLSKPAAVAPTETRPTTRSNSEGTSNAAESLAALTADPRKGLKNRLRRAFSFGSAAELRKAAAGNSNDVAERARLRQEKFREEQQARNAERQGVTGFGEGIYNGQGGFFTGSTDNVSVSSTASSASIMIRKMGKGMRRSTRSLVGLFRPKSVVGVPSPDSPVIKPSAAVAQVTPLTVEAERDKVNANVDSQGQVGGGTAIPKLEKNPIDSVASNSAAGVSSGDASSNNGETEEPVYRKSIIGREKERAELLAAVRKGILKRSASASPVIKPADKADGGQKQHRKVGSLSIEGGEDYFISSQRFRGSATSSNSAPSSPNGSRYNVSFSPRITFHDTWPSGEYDRRGDIATCNRLTPLLAQQIKEELNTFKMEMDVHEESKIYTHFF